MGLPKRFMLLSMGLNPRYELESPKEFLEKIRKPEPPPDVLISLPEAEAWDLESFTSSPSETNM